MQQCKALEGTHKLGTKLADMWGIKYVNYLPNVLGCVSRTGHRGGRVLYCTCMQHTKTAVDYAGAAG